MVKITGAKEHAARLRGLTTPEAKRQIGAALKRGGDLLAVEAQISITTGAVSGKGHTPSAAGTPPNNDTGVLADSIAALQFVERKGDIVVRVVADAPYAAAQEFGNSKLPERPYMRPAAAKMRDQIKREVGAALNHIAQGGSVVRGK